MAVLSGGIISTTVKTYVTQAFAAEFTSRSFRGVGPARSIPVVSRTRLAEEQQNGTQDRYHSMMNSSNSRTVPVQLIRKTSVDDFNEKMIGMLDEVEKRVEQLRFITCLKVVFLKNLRESAGQLEQEKESLIDMLGNVNLNSELLRLGQGNSAFILELRRTELR
ncbi:unnamed protein product [Gongylonema pulchrum]|uniref:IF rod domain-containing protein n=1 Tax=Gongylonema pulchrum TaxID=637853 RepID=A0A183DYS5_9BILA|nr:unnamed protein product [Gongylonema pulchrum]